MMTLSRMRSLLAAVLSLAVVACGGASAADSGPTTEQLDAAARQAVKAQLKDPESARFDSVRVIWVAGEYKGVCGLVNSRNSFGGYAGSRRFLSGGQTVFIEGEAGIRPAIFDSSWTSVCGGWLHR